MRNRKIEQEMYRLAVELIEKRYPEGWGWRWQRNGNVLAKMLNFIIN